jgi:molybdopterin-guanine dinucleotide biosynthesis protein A
VAARGRLLAAIVLAGGQGRRLGGVDKASIKLGARSLVGAVVGAAIRTGADRVVVVGPDRPGLTDELAEAGLGTRRARIDFARERPPGSGPVPALRAGLDLVTEPWLLLLAADLPFLSVTVLRDLVDAASLSGGAVLADDQDRPQWLVSCWHAAGLRAAIAGYAGDSLRGLLAPLPRAELTAVAEPGAPPCWLDCDTPDDLALARQLAQHHAVKELS